MRGQQVVLKVAGVVFMTVLSLQSAEFRLPGGRATAMGGAGVAGAGGAWSTYYNPAALAETGRIHTRAGVGLHLYAREQDLIIQADRLADYDWDDITDDPLGNAADAAAVADILRDVPDDAGLMIGGGGGFFGQIGTFGAGVLVDAQIAFKPTIDRVRLNVTSPADPNSIANNDSEVRVLGLVLSEVPLAYGHRLETDFGMVDVGGAVKFIKAITYDGTVSVTDTDNDDLEDELETYDEDDGGFGVDLGVLYHAPTLPLRLGLLARNINSPSFDTWDGGSIKEKMQLRAGAEVELVEEWLVLAADYAATENETLFPGYKSRMGGIGIAMEGYPGIFAGSLRLGLMKNLAESDSSVVYTAGLGFGLKWFNVTLSGAVSGDETTYDGDSFPTESYVSLALDSAW